MLLALDVGNTETVVGLFDGEDLVSRWRTATNAERTADEHALLVTQLLGLQGHECHEVVTGMAVSSTVPRLRATLREMSELWFGVPTVVLEPGVRSGMPILYEDPREVGADRIANGVAAYERYGGPSVVVDFGTATTLDAVSAQGEYLGGAIVPGIEIGVDALFSRAAALPRIEVVEPRRVIGKSTVESIRSGAVFGSAALVDGMCDRFERELGECTVIATGGLSGLITPHSRRIDHNEPWLTLHGLRLVFERNTPAA